MAFFRCVVIVVLALASSTVLAAECVYEAVGDLQKRVEASRAEVEAANRVLTAARDALAAQLRPSQITKAVAWRAADDSVKGANTLEQHVDMIRLVKAIYDPKQPPNTTEQAVLTFSDALKAANEKKTALEDQQRCLNELFGIGGGHTNSIVLVGDEAKLGYVYDPTNDKDAGPEIIDKLRAECLAGTDIRRLGVSMGLTNLTRVEGLTPYTRQRQESETESQVAPVALTPERGLLIMAAEYAGEYRDNELKLKCVRLMYLGQAALTSISVGTYGYGTEGQNRVDLLRGPLASRVSGRLRDALYVGIPVRKLMSYQTSRAAEDVLMDGQGIELEITRARNKLERSRTPAPSGTTASTDTFATSWEFRVADMPRAIIRMPLIAGLVLTDDPKSGDKPVWTAGPALGLSYRAPITAKGWEGRYISPEVFVHVAQRIGDSTDVPDTMWGGGVQIDLSGYLGVGIAYMGDLRFTKPQWVFTITPVPWISHALGLEKTLGK